MTQHNVASGSGSGRIRIARFLFFILSVLMSICIALQTYIAGAAVFGHVERWDDHVTFVHLFEFLPVFMLIAAFVGKLSAALKWQSAGLLLLIFAQYFTANFPGAGAVHPLIALVLFWLSIHVVIQAYRGIRRKTA
jgi:hypothetical protein